MSGVMHDKEHRAENWALGTPQRQECGEERLLLHLTRKQREDLNQFRPVPRMLNQEDRRVSRILWSMASTAADRSRRQRHEFVREPINKVIVYVNVM